jgi:Uncharacterized enzyme involved in biosynthesis of extracellular polysaccharides
MIIVLFRSKLVANPEGYNAMSDEMDVLARTVPGFIDVKSYTADDGERLTIVWWEDAETLKQWREQERHRVAQHQGRQQWYEYYKMEVAEVTRTSTFERRACASSAKAVS